MVKLFNGHCTMEILDKVVTDVHDGNGNIFVSLRLDDNIIDKSQFNNKEDTVKFLKENYTVEELEEKINLWDFYISGNNIGIVIPTIYAMGGYSLFEVPRTTPTENGGK